MPKKETSTYEEFRTMKGTWGMILNLYFDIFKCNNNVLVLKLSFPKFQHLQGTSLTFDNHFITSSNKALQGLDKQRHLGEPELIVSISIASKAMKNLPQFPNVL